MQDWVRKALASTSKMKNCVITNKSPEKSRHHSTQQAAYSGENLSAWQMDPHPAPPALHQHMLPSPWRLSSRCWALGGAPAHSTELHHKRCVYQHAPTWTHPHGSSEPHRRTDITAQHGKTQGREGDRVCYAMQSAWQAPLEEGKVKP